MTSQENNIQKIFEAILIINWKTGQCRLAKRNPKNLNGLEVPIKIRLKLNIPKMSEIVADGEITLSQVKANEIFIHELG